MARFTPAAREAVNRYRYRKYRAVIPRIAYAEPAVRAVLYRKYRPYVLAVVLAWMAIRRLGRHA
jgi:hypothetical protein